MSRPTAISPEEQEQIARKIGVLLLQGAPEDWQEITVEYRATGEYHDLLGEVTAQDGSSRSLEPPVELREIFESLREGMYRPDVGTWLSALYVVERPSSYRIDINFDTEPGWQRPLPRAAYVDELRHYPRAAENIPDWMRDRIDGPAANAPVNGAPVAQSPMAESPMAESSVAEPHAVVPPVVEPPVAEQVGALEPEVDEPTGFQVANTFDDFDELGRPVVADREPIPAEEIAQLREYLENAPVVLAAREDEEDQLDPERPTVVPGTWHTDGTWLWPGAIAFYLAQYGVPPEPELVAHVRRRGFQLAEVDDATRDAAVSELIDQPTDTDDEPGDFDDEPQSSAVEAPEVANAEPMIADGVPSYAGEAQDFDDEPRGFAEPEAAEVTAVAVVEDDEVEQTGGSRRVLDDEEELPDTESVLGKLHDRLTEFQVDSGSYRIGSVSENARCLVQEGPDWVVTAERGEDVRFARIDHAAAYLLGSLLLEEPAADAPQVAEPSVPEADLSDDESDIPQHPESDLPQRTPEAALPQRAPEAELPQRPEADLPQRTPEPSLPQRAPESGLPQRTPESDLPQRATESDLPQRAPASDLLQRTPEPGLPQRTPGDALPQPQRAPEPELPQRTPEPAAANPLFTANQEPSGPSTQPEPPVQQEAAPPAAQPSEEAPRLQQAPQLDRPAAAGPPSPPVGQPVQQPPAGGPGAPPPLPKRQPRQGGNLAPQQGAPGPVGGAERRPGPGGPGMAGPHRQGPPPGPPRPPQGGGQQPGGQAGPPGGQQIQPLNGEPPLTLYRDRRVIMLQPGTELDRFGEPNGNVLYTMRTPYTHRSLPPQWSNRSYFAYRIQRPIQAMRGTAVPWFEQPGGGTAFVLPAPISDLLADGTLAEMPATERPPME